MIGLRDVRAFLNNYKDNISYGLNILTNSLRNTYFTEDALTYIVSQNVPKSMLRIICEHQGLSENFMAANADIMIWYQISKFQKLSESFMRKFADKLDWARISRFQKLSIKFILEFKDKIRFKNLAKNKYLTFAIISHPDISPLIDSYLNYSFVSTLHLNEEYMTIHKDVLNWDTISRNDFIPLELLLKFADKLNWEDLYYKFKLNMDIAIKYRKKMSLVMFYRILLNNITDIKSIDKIKDTIDWTYLSEIIPQMTITQGVFDFISRYKDYINWQTFTYKSYNLYNNIGFCKKFKNDIDWSVINLSGASIEFINTFMDYIPLNNLPLNTIKFSEEFLIKHINEWTADNWESIWANQIVSEKFMEDNIEKINWYYIARTQKLAESFIRKHINKFKDFLNYISTYQNISEDFREEYDLV